MANHTAPRKRTTQAKVLQLRALGQRRRHGLRALVANVVVCCHPATHTYTPTHTQTSSGHAHTRNTTHTHILAHVEYGNTAAQ